MYNKNLALKETIDQQLMWQTSLGLMQQSLKKGEGIFSPKKSNDSCPFIQNSGDSCPTMWNIVESGQLSKGTTDKRLIPLTFGHFSQVCSSN